MLKQLQLTETIINRAFIVNWRAFYNETWETDLLIFEFDDQPKQEDVKQALYQSYDVQERLFEGDEIKLNEIEVLSLTPLSNMRAYPIICNRQIS